MGEKARSYNYKWLVWGILALGYVVVFFHRVAAGVVREDLVAAFSISDVEFGNLGAMYFYAYMFMQIPSGILADTLGARKTVFAGTLLAGIGSVMFGMAPNIMMAYVGRLVVGLGVSVVFIAILKVLSQWFKEDEFGRMSGLTSFIGNGGSLLAQFPLVIMVAEIGWRSSFNIIGAVTIIIAILSYMIVRNSPEEIGLAPIAPKVEKKHISISDGIKTVFTNFRTWPGFFIFGGMFGSFISFIGAWGVPYFMNVYGMAKKDASTFTMTATVGLMIGSLVVGNISDKIGKRKLPCLGFSLAYLASWLILIFVSPGALSNSVLYALCFVMGFAASGFVLSWAVGKEVNPIAYSGLAMGTVNMGGFLFSAVIQPMIGGVLQSSEYKSVVDGITVYGVEAYNSAFMICIGATAIAIVGVLLMKETNCKNIYSSSNGNGRAA